MMMEGSLDFADQDPKYQTLCGVLHVATAALVYVAVGVFVAIAVLTQSLYHLIKATELWEGANWLNVMLVMVSVYTLCTAVLWVCGFRTARFNLMRLHIVTHTVSACLALSVSVLFCIVLVLDMGREQDTLADAFFVPSDTYVTPPFGLCLQVAVCSASLVPFYAYSALVLHSCVEYLRERQQATGKMGAKSWKVGRTSITLQSIAALPPVNVKDIPYAFSNDRVQFP